MLAADLTVSGSLRIDGQVMSGGTDAVRTINAGGDIFVTGKLVGAGLGGHTAGARARGRRGDRRLGQRRRGGRAAGRGGGPISLSAATVAVTGLVSSSGADGRTEGPAGGGVQIAARELFHLAPTGKRPPAGRRGLGGRQRRPGREPDDRRAGRGPDSPAPSTRAAAWSPRLVPAGAHGGAAGAILIGETTRPAAVEIAVGVLATGGTGRALGGAGGTITLEPKLGGLTIAGTLDVSGGASATQAGPGGSVTAPVEGADQRVDGGDILLAGRIVANGGAISVGGVGNGGEAGQVTLDAHSLLGTLTVAPEGTITVDGGDVARRRGRGGRWPRHPPRAERRHDDRGEAVGQGRRRRRATPARAASAVSSTSSATTTTTATAAIC